MKAERGELPRVQRTPGKAKSEARLEFEGLVAKVANRLRPNGAEATGKERPVRAHDEANPTSADDESPELLLAKLLRKVHLASDKVH